MSENGMRRKQRGAQSRGRQTEDRPGEKRKTDEDRGDYCNTFRIAITELWRRRGKETHFRCRRHHSQPVHTVSVGCVYFSHIILLVLFSFLSLLPSLSVSFAVPLSHFTRLHTINCGFQRLPCSYQQNRDIHFLPFTCDDWKLCVLIHSTTLTELGTVILYGMGHIFLLLLFVFVHAAVLRVCVGVWLGSGVLIRLILCS